MAARTPVEWVVVDASQINWIDATAVQRLDELQSESAERSLTLGVARVKLSLGRALDPGRVAQRLASTGLRRFPTLKAAVNAFTKRKLDVDPDQAAQVSSPVGSKADELGFRLLATSGVPRVAKSKRKGVDPKASAKDARALQKMTRKEFEKELSKLQVELTRLQAWAVAEGARVIVVFEGRDTAGKGGVISRIMQRCSPRVFRHVALPKPSDREKSQLYIQRYIAHFPAAGEIVLFDRSWYNRAGVERVMGFCSDDEYEHFLRLAPAVEREVIHNGIILLKYFLDVSQAEQRRRFEARISDPVKHWKLSPMDVESVRRWWDYTKAYQAMLEATDTPAAPWHVVPADDKRRARLNLIRHLLSSIPYEKVRVDRPEIPKATPRPKGAQEGLRAGQVVPNLY